MPTIDSSIIPCPRFSTDHNQLLYASRINARAGEAEAEDRKLRRK
jgi:hypothetical protein